MTITTLYTIAENFRPILCFQLIIADFMIYSMRESFLNYQTFKVNYFEIYKINILIYDTLDAE